MRKFLRVARWCGVVAAVVLAWNVVRGLLGVEPTWSLVIGLVIGAVTAALLEQVGWGLRDARWDDDEVKR